MKIILCTTFRDFKGTDNDKIQYMFLENIKNQTFQDYLIVTTTFGELKVKDVVDRYFGKKSITKNVNMPEGYRFSLSEVVLTGIDVAKRLKEDCLIIWCTCDIMFDSNFFQTLICNYEHGLSGIAHPNIIYTSIDNMNKNINPEITIYKGIDLLFFDSRVLIEAERDIINYRFYDWGVFELFLVGIAMVYSKKRVNIYTSSPIKKVINDRKLTEESKAYFKRCLDMNNPVFWKYCSDKGLPSKLYTRGWVYDCHCQFKVLNPTLDYLCMKYAYEIKRAPRLFRMFLSRIYHNI